jgi:asparagine synthase (glutamine-hydrolysing)
MCGICGEWNTRGVEIKSLQRMLDNLRHRGPDDEGYYINESLGLANCRLSIIDLEKGKQPISNEDETIWIVFNGEIYNYRILRDQLIERGHHFKTQSDTEVIVHMYEDFGPDCVKELRGMFAFAIWDKLAQRLFIARDPLGQKPLYYTYGEGSFTFASEIKALIHGCNISPRLNARAMHHLISLRAIPERDTLFENIYKLPAGHTLTLENGERTIRAYWDIQYTPKLNWSANELIDQLNKLMIDTVSCHMISDVPLGAFLSGGLDSTLIAAIMSTLSQAPVKTFSLGVKEQDFNELPYARKVSQLYGTEHYELIVEPDLITNLPIVIKHMEEPIDPYAFGVYLVAQQASKQVKVVLGGDGGDEMFAGYDRYLGNQIVDIYCLVPSLLRRQLIEPFIQSLTDNFRYNNLVQKLRWMIAMSKTSAGERYAQSACFLRFGHGHKETLYTKALWNELGGDDSSQYLLRFFNADNATHPVDKMLYTDLKTRLADHLLMITDRMTMSHSLECRSPYVDQHVAEFVATIPANLKLNGRHLRYIQRQLAKKYLPDSLIRRPKHGFGFPLAYWFSNELRELTTHYIRNSNLVAEGYFRPEAMIGILDEHLSGQIDHNYRIWLLLNLEFWHRLFIEGQKIEDLQNQIESIRC